MKTIIVDDERLARKELISLLASFDFVEVIKECANADEAKKAIEELKPDLVFLDIQMKDGSGYPLGIHGNKISDGAKLLAIIDLYIDLTLVGKQEHNVMAPIDAIIVINKTYKHALSGKWLRLFNKGMASYLKA